MFFKSIDNSIWCDCFDDIYNKIIHDFSSGLSKSYGLPALSETLSAENESVLSDQSDLASASSALSAVLSEFSRVGLPEQVWHFVVN